MGTTKTVNTELYEVWEDYYDDEPVYSIRTDRGDKTLLCTLSALEKDKQACELIVTAVNACKTINPDNPLNAAKALPHVIEVLKKYKSSFSGELWLAIYDLLNQVTE